MMIWHKHEAEDLYQETALEELERQRRGEAPDADAAKRAVWNRLANQAKSRWKIRRRARQWTPRCAPSFADGIDWRIDFERRLALAPAAIQGYYRAALAGRRHVNWDGEYGQRVRRILTMLITGHPPPPERRRKGRTWRTT